MNRNVSSQSKLNMLLRAIYMLLMLLVLHVCGTVLVIVAILQYVVVLLLDEPNERLVALGKNLGNYLRHITHFLSYGTEVVPFPFSDWPAGD